MTFFSPIKWLPFLPPLPRSRLSLVPDNFVLTQTNPAVLFAANFCDAINTCTVNGQKNISQGISRGRGTNRRSGRTRDVRSISLDVVNNKPLIIPNVNNTGTNEEERPKKKGWKRAINV